MSNEKTIVATAITGTTTQCNEISRHEILSESKKTKLVDAVSGLFLLTEPSVFIEHLNFLQNFFQENYDPASKAYEKEFIEDNLSFVNQLKLEITKQYQLFRDIDFIEYKIELLTSKPN